MIPSALVRQLEQGMEDFLRVSFWSSSPGFDTMLERFLAGEGTLEVEGRRGSPVFRGPFVSLKLPFATGTATCRSTTIPSATPVAYYRELDRNPSLATSSPWRSVRPSHAGI